MNVIDYIKNDQLVKENVWSNQKIILTLELFGFDRILQELPMCSLSEELKIKLHHAYDMLTNPSYEKLQE